MIAFKTLALYVRRAYTIRSTRHTLQAAGLPADIGTASCVLIGAPEFIVAAALARASVGE